MSLAFSASSCGLQLGYYLGGLRRPKFLGAILFGSPAQR